MRYPEKAKELLQLLRADQSRRRRLGRVFFDKSTSEYQAEVAKAKANTDERTQRMLQILDEIGEPSISNIGVQGAQAVSVLATHSTLANLKKVLAAFNKLYGLDREDTFHQAIPAMTDWALILERKPQKFGTQWIFDKDKHPFLPTTEDIAHVNDRRAEYGIGPLRWPKSLAISESSQPWLKKPLSELTMRDLTDEEYKNLMRE